MNLIKFPLAIFVSFLFSISASSAGDRISRSEIPSDLVKWLIKHIEKRVHLSSEEMEALNQKLKCDLHDLNGDGIPEFILHIESHFWCGAGTNCHYWLVQRASKGYRLLLEDMCIHLGDCVSKGYRDLVSEESMGSRRDVTYKGDREVAVYRQEIAVRVYKYDGKKYRLRKSFDKLIPFEQ